MKKHWKDIVFFACVALVAIMLACAITGCQEYKQEHFKTRIYELVNKTTEVRTHRYLMMENAVETDHILVWKSETGRTFSCEVGRNSFYHYEIGKRYRFKMMTGDPSNSRLKWLVDKFFQICQTKQLLKRLFSYVASEGAVNIAG